MDDLTFVFYVVHGHGGFESSVANLTDFPSDLTDFCEEQRKKIIFEG